MDNERPYRYRYQYVRLENSADSSTSARLIHLNFYTYPAELPFIEGYKFNDHMNLEAWEHEAKQAKLIVEPLRKFSSEPSVGACSNRPCEDINCEFHKQSVYYYWSEALNSWHDCGHYYHPVGYENQCDPIKEN